MKNEREFLEFLILLKKEIGIFKCFSCSNFIFIKMLNLKTEKFCVLLIKGTCGSK